MSFVLVSDVCPVYVLSLSVSRGGFIRVSIVEGWEEKRRILERREMAFVFM